MKQQEAARKQLTWRDYKEIAVRRRWSLLGPFFALGLAGFVVAHVWPAQFRSEALVLVDEQQVPDRYVMPNVVSNPETRLQSITQEILSRTRLQEIIDKFTLYPKQRAHNTSDQLVDQMRQDIEIVPVTSKDQPDQLTGFRISYAAPGPITAQQVVNDLTSLFIQEDIQSRTQESQSTTSFFDTQLQQAEQDLETQEKRLATYKTRYLGELPQQEQSNLEILSNLQTQLGAASASLDRAQQEKTFLESSRAQYEELDSAADGHGASADPDVQLRLLRAKLAELEAQFTPRYPDVISTQEEIAHWEEVKKQSDTAQAAAAKDPASNNAALQTAALESSDPGRSIDVESRLKANAIEIADYQKDMKNIQGQITQIESHLNATPVREEELEAVTRDADNARQNYQSLLDKKTQSQLATTMEEHQEGEHFRVIDAPSLPQKPSDPNRAEIILGGWLLGLVVSGGLTALEESADTRLRSESELRTQAGVPVLASIPTVLSQKEEKFWAFYRRVEVAGVALLVILSAGTILYTYLAG